ncbi:Prophage tail fiber assembly protein TfaE [Mixta theicola]|nr:tail fiber assembly protein [Mixta theicola]QHM74155.1 Prophage tail fiber assembly protein TfaE [Mixta theicola]
MTEQIAQLDINGLAISSGYISVYNYDAATGEYTGQTDEYLFQGVGIPACSTCTAPPDTDAGYVVVYQEHNWMLLPDHRGETVYSTADGSAITINAPGDYPADTTPLSPSTAFDRWTGNEWVTDRVAQQVAATAQADAERAARIADANRITQAWQSQLLLGIITDDDKTRLAAWMRYVQLLQATDILAAPDISWPEPPER